MPEQTCFTPAVHDTGAFIAYDGFVSKHPDPIPAREEGDLAERAYRYILDRILRGVWPLGAEINRRKIAADLGVSVLPVSEALQRLEQELLVESGRRVGTRIRIPTPQEIRGFCIVREALETQAARLFAERASATERRDIVSLAADVDRLYEENAEHPEQATEASMHQLRLSHRNFHLRIADGSSCPYLRQQIEKNQHLVFNSFYDKLFGARRLPNNWHVSMAESVASVHVDDADQATRKHVRHHLEEIMYRLEPYLSLDHGRISLDHGRISLDHGRITTDRLAP